MTKERLEFETVRDLASELRQEFFSLFGFWVVDQPAYEKKLLEVNEEVSKAFLGIVNDNDGKARPREDVIVEFRQFTASLADETSSKINELLNTITRGS